MICALVQINFSMLPGFTLFAHAAGTRTRHTRAVTPLTGVMKVAVVGCAHGELDALYDAVREAESVAGKVDLVVCPGDFQAVRNASDLACMACPEKYRKMNSFWRYYSGAARAPWPTVFVGGNHEAPNHLQELSLGGLVAPNMYYLGDAGVVNVRGLRIAGVSGVYVPHHYRVPRSEHPPYPRNQVKSVYHAREEDIRRLRRLRSSVDIMISHDWPQDIAFRGDTEDLLQRKPFLRKEIERSELGHPGTKKLLEHMKPRYWFAAHMHVKFAARIAHDDENVTRFLALDKILPKRDFLQIIDIPVEEDAERVLFEQNGLSLLKDECAFELDPEWLTILRSEVLSGGPLDTTVTDEEIKELTAHVKETKTATSCRSISDFERTASIHNPADGDRANRPTALKRPSWTTKMSEALGIPLQSDAPKSSNELDSKVESVNEEVENNDDARIEESATKKLKISA